DGGDVRIVARPYRHVLEPVVLAEEEAPHRVADERRGHLAPEVGTGRLGEVRSRRRVVVQLLEPEGNPADSYFRDGDLEPWIALHHARRDQVRERGHRIELVAVHRVNLAQARRIRLTFLRARVD